MSNTEEKKTVTGLDQAENRQEAEYDLLTALLEAASYKTDEENIVEFELRRNKKLLFTVRVHPLGDQEVKLARKKATTYMPNPNGRKLPPIEKEFDLTKFKSWMIYLATTEEDQQRIWGNPEFMKRKNLQQPYESIDEMLKSGEKDEIFLVITDISEMDEDGNPMTSDGEEGMSDTEFAKN